MQRAQLPARAGSTATTQRCSGRSAAVDVQCAAFPGRWAVSNAWTRCGGASGCSAPTTRRSAISRTPLVVEAVRAAFLAAAAVRKQCGGDRLAHEHSARCAGWICASHFICPMVISLLHAAQAVRVEKEVVEGGRAAPGACHASVQRAHHVPGALLCAVAPVDRRQRARIEWGMPLIDQPAPTLPRRACPLTHRWRSCLQRS